MTTPPFTITSTILTQVATISELVGRLEANLPEAQQVLLRRGNRIRTIQGSLAIEGNTLNLDQVTAVIEGKRILGSPKEVQEVRGALAAYEAMEQWNSHSLVDLLQAHALLMTGLVDNPGSYRTGGSGIQRGNEIVHGAPPAANVPGLMNDLLLWLDESDDHPLIKACVFHYEFEFIHPFVDGNGRMGRLWQTLILSQWKPLFALVPVESLVREQQAGYYVAINASDAVGHSTSFIEFMLGVITDALAELLNNSPQVNTQVSPQVMYIIGALDGEVDREMLQQALGLKDRKSFRQRYLKPALEAGLIEMTNPDNPRAHNQRYRLTDMGLKLRARC